MKKCTLLLLVPALLGLTPGNAFACAVCFGAKGDPVVDAVGIAILFLLGFVGCILAGIVAFAVTLARRSRRYQQQLQEGEAEWDPSPQYES